MTILIAGAGLAGLSAATALGRAPREILERAESPGGLVASRARSGYTFDHTGHLFHLSGEPKDFVHRRIGTELRAHDRRAVVHWRGIWMPYPFQANLHRLPADVRAACEAGLATASAGDVDRSSFARWSETTWGPGITETFLRPYNEKLYGRRLEDLTADYVGYIPRRGAHRAGAPAGYNARFEYPKRGGSGRIVEVLAKEAGGISCGASLAAIDAAGRGVEIRGTWRKYGRILSAVALPELLSMIRDAPPEVRAARAVLEGTTVRVLNLGVRGLGPDWHWAYFPDPEFSFYRVGHYTGFSPESAPPGRFSLYVEIAEPPRVQPPSEDPIDALVHLGILPDRDAIEVRDEFRIPAAYTLPLPGRGEAVRAATRWLESVGIHPIGRYGRWTYTSMGEAILDGLRTADRVRSLE